MGTTVLLLPHMRIVSINTLKIARGSDTTVMGGAHKYLRQITVSRIILSNLQLRVDGKKEEMLLPSQSKANG